MPNIEELATSITTAIIRINEVCGPGAKELDEVHKILSECDNELWAIVDIFEEQ